MFNDIGSVVHEGPCIILYSDIVGRAGPVEDENVILVYRPIETGIRFRKFVVRFHNNDALGDQRVHIVLKIGTYAERTRILIGRRIVIGQGRYYLSEISANSISGRFHLHSGIGECYNYIFVRISGKTAAHLHRYPV